MYNSYRCFRGSHCIVLKIYIHRRNRFAPTWAVHFFHSFANSPAKRGVQNRTWTPYSRTFTKTSAILLQTPLVSCWHQRGAFGNPFSGRDFHPAHLGTSRHKLSVQGCLDIPSQWSWILKFTFRLWGKNSHRDGWPDLKQDPLPLMAPQLLNHTCC